MSNSVIIDCFPESITRYQQDYAVVVVDVIRATTTAVTALALTRRCFAVSSEKAAFELAARLEHPLLIGELSGDMPPGFDMNNSPAQLARRSDLARPLVLLSSSGSKLIEAAGDCQTGYVACFRNARATAAHILRHPRVAVIGAGSRGEFREEDQMCCAWIAASLLDNGYLAENHETSQVVDRWRAVPVSACADGHSAQYLRRSHQLEDLDFVLQHVNDLDLVCIVRNGEVSIGPAVEETASLAASRGSVGLSA